MNCPSEARGRLTPYAWEELEALPRRRALIKGLLECSAMSLVYGVSNCCKTFFVLDVALHIVLGRSWQEKRTRQGAVVYIAAEGGLGLKERLDAFSKDKQLDGYGPFYLIPCGVDLCNADDDTQELINQISAIDNVELVVVDTLSRAMAGGNENSPDDMGAFIGNCDKIREHTRAHLLIVHHAGKDSTRGARGHSALRAAVDTEIEVINDAGVITAEIKKQRDGKTGDQYCYELKPVALGKDEDGDDISSCVLVSTDERPAKKQKLSPQKSRALQILRTCLIEKGQTRYVRKEMPEVLSVKTDEYKEYLARENIVDSDEPDNIRRSISRIVTELNNGSITGTYGDYIWIPD